MIHANPCLCSLEASQQNPLTAWGRRRTSDREVAPDNAAPGATKARRDIAATYAGGHPDAGRRDAEHGVD